VFTTVIVGSAKLPVLFAKLTENPIYGPSAENLSSPQNHAISRNSLSTKQIYFCKVGRFTLFNPLS
jgi:hypothetical protein